VKSLRWQIYFAFFFTVTLASLTLMNVLYLTQWQGIERDWENFPHDILIVIECCGLYGYVFSKRLLSPTIWKIVFTASLAVFVYEIASLTYDHLQDTDTAHDAAFVRLLTIAIALMYFPLWVALYGYGWKEAATWQLRTSH
jgi:hypothetical protein